MMELRDSAPSSTNAGAATSIRLQRGGEGGGAGQGRADTGVAAGCKWVSSRRGVAVGVLAEAAAPQRDKHQTAARGGGGGCLRRGRVGAKQAQVWQQGAGGSAAGGCVWRCGFCRAVHHDPSITCQHLNNVPHTPQGSPWDAHPPHTHTPAPQNPFNPLPPHTHRIMMPLK